MIIRCSTGLDFMKKVFAILILFSVGFVCAQSSPSIGTPAPREHRGFYNSMSFGLAYNWFDNSRNDIDRYGKEIERDVDFYEYNGFSFSLIEFKFGYALGDIVAFHTVFNMSFFVGSLDYYNEAYKTVCTDEGACVETRDVNNFEDPTSATGYNFRTYLGFGSTFYPFRNKKSPLHGFFVGASAGYTLFVTVADGHGDSGKTGNGGIGFQMELGKEWWMNDHFSIGVGLGFAHNGLVWETVDSHKSDNVLSISFRLTRG